MGVSPTAGFTKSMQEVQLDSKVRLLDSPGVIFDEDHDPGSLLLRNCISADALEDPVEVATAIVKRCRVEQLMEWFAGELFIAKRVSLQSGACKGKAEERGCAGQGCGSPNHCARLERWKGALLHSAAP